MSRTRPHRALREAADYLLNVASLQPKLHQRAVDLSAELRQAEQEHQETLHWYSREWAAARKEQEDLRKGLTALQDDLDKANAELRTVQAKVERTLPLLQQESVEVEVHPTERGVNLKPNPPDPEIEVLRRQLEQLKRKINSPRFWSGTFAETFAESLASMDAIHHAFEVSTAAEVTAVFRSWQGEIATGIELFEEAGFDADLAEHLRRLLICQWVYLRWQEVTS